MISDPAVRRGLDLSPPACTLARRSDQDLDLAQASRAPLRVAALRGGLPVETVGANMLLAPDLPL